MTQLRPKFEVHEVHGEDMTRKTCEKDPKGGFIYKTVKDTRRCFDVYFPNGHSVRIRGEDELKRLGFAGAPNLVDMETGDEVPNQQAMSLKTHVERSTKPSKSKGMSDG